MASSMLTGERRWASARKTGMTVLGKVPKPMNLPSQRLENHGLDPSVEIVPKGTLTWGSKPSSAATNAWGTSSVSSPHAEGSIGSPSFASGRPSSGGSGTRPSTAGSDRSYEPVSNAWGPSSRPSSASGILASSQMSAAGTRPRSADTRPGSSQLSRFAENSVDNTVAWGSTGTAERLGAISSKARGFTLSSGDFPTLGSEKNSDSHSQRGHSSQGRPASASGTSSTLKETLEPHLIENRNVDHSDHGNVNTWKAENHPYVGDGAPPYMENWQKDPQQAQSYTNVNIPPRNFDSWRNPPFHPADAAWYRGGGPVGPYRPSGPPGSYFDPHVSARPLPNSQAVPRPDASSVGYRPNNGEPYRPHMPPEPYMGPGYSNMPRRPGPYPGPVPYEGYYGPQAGFYNSSEKGPIMPMVRPVVYNQYPSQNLHLDPGNYHARPGGYATTMNEEQIKLGQTHENQGQFRVLLKQHDVREGREVHGKPEQSLMGTAPHLEREIQPGLLRQEGDRRTKIQKAEAAKTLSLPPVEGAPSMHKSSSLDGDSSDCHHRNFSENSIKEADDRLIRREETTNARVRDRKQYPVMKKNSPLMEKGVGLHTKAQITDRQNDFGMCSSKEKTKSKDVTITADQSTSMVNVPTSNDVILVPGKPNALTEEKYHESTTVDKVLHVPSLPLGTCENVHFQGQTRVHDVKGIDHQGESRSSRHDNDERMKKVPGSESSITTCLSSKGILLASPLDSAASVVAPEKHGVPHAASSGDGSYSASSLDTIDHKAQRAKVKEMATQRAKQLQKEEEERTREQKAKALAKLEELNRRTSAESSNQKVNNSPPSSDDLLDKKQDPGAGMVLKADMAFAGAPLGTCSEAVTPTDDDGTRNAENLINATSDVAAQHSDSAVQTSDLSQNQHLEPSQGTVSKKVMHETAPDIHGTSSKHEQLGYGRRQTITPNRSMGEKQASTVSTGNPEYTVAMNTSTSDVPASIEENSVRHRKKNNKSARNNKNKPDEGLPNSSFPSPDTELVPQKLHPGSRKSNASVSAAEAISVSSESLHATVVPAEALSVENSSEIPDMPLKQGLTESTEESQARVNDHWKPHPHRKSAKTQQTNKSVPKYNVGVEAVIWAPVKPLNKNGPSVEVSKNSVIEATYPSGKSGHDMQSGIKAKRAEMERYIPKPVAKELSQQVNSQQNPPSQTQPEAGDMSGKLESNRLTVEFGKLDGVTVGKATVATDTRSGENIKHNKHGKTSSSWRQRSSVTPPVEGSLPSDPPKADQKASDQLQPSTTDSVLKRDMTHIHDGWNDVTITSPPGGSVAAVPKNVGANRQRRQPYKAQRVPGSSYPTDNTDTHRVVTDRRETHSPALVLNNSDGGKVMKTESENAAVGEHSKPHWQPKSQAYSHHGRQGNRGTGVGQRVPAQGTDCNVVQNEHKNDTSPRTVAAEAGDVRHQDAKRGGKVVGDASKDDTTVGSAPVDVNPQHQQSAALEVGHQGHYNNRLQRGQDSRYGGKDMGQDAGKRNFHTNGDERKNSQHLEYQQIGSYHKPGESYQQNPASSGGAYEGPRAPGPRFRERGRHHPRAGGHFYGRGSGVARVGDSYNSGG
ncbi:protein MODIFIER OF SNC1 1-like [Iris pallida]|uniref:Protein MODIFIER OF SNC1 1-like n=1 Tax=Iris pallida TaxID=29817 RepID=A0AAX6IE27_IRIPA|nr:protein MODIFIER OF SNC1 1-like [Iris pallida]